MERGGNDVHRFEESLKMAKEGIMEACEIFEDMKEQFSERGGYGERYSQRYSQRGGLRRERPLYVPRLGRDARAPLP
jgi:hypothetical protein